LAESGQLVGAKLVVLFGLACFGLFWPVGSCLVGDEREVIGERWKLEEKLQVGCTPDLEQRPACA
jgi:hypothetical protein